MMRLFTLFINLAGNLNSLARGIDALRIVPETPTILSSSELSCNYLIQIETGVNARHAHFNYLEMRSLRDGVQSEWQIGQTFQGYHMNLCAASLTLPSNVPLSFQLEALQQAPHIIAVEKDHEVKQTGWLSGGPMDHDDILIQKDVDRGMDREEDTAFDEEDESSQFSSCYNIIGQQQGTTACQNDATWSLHRIANRNAKIPLSTANLSYSFSYVYEPPVRPVVYVMDTQVWVKHPQFGGRAQTVKSYVDLIEDGDSTTPFPPHGTHVSGIVGAARYGVQKWTQLLSVVTLGKTGTGSFSNVLNGATWIAADAAQRASSLPAIVNLSLSGAKSVVVNAAMDALVTAGVIVVVAVGNSHTDACNQSPASAIKPVKVAASDSKDQFASFTNFGQCVDVIAPGVTIQSTGPYNKMITMSGTSMSSPNVAGIIASALANGDITTAQARDNYQLKYFLNQHGLRDTIGNVAQSTNNLLVQTANVPLTQCGDHVIGSRIEATFQIQ